MKSIVYILITIITAGILISSFPKTSLATKKTFTLQCIHDNHSAEMLNKSAKIIESRLNDCGIPDVDVTVDNNLSCINVQVDSEIDSLTLSNLCISKGKVKFYETYDRLEVIKNLGTDSELAELLNIPTEDKELHKFSGIFGYCKEDNKSQVDSYIKKNYVSAPGQGINFFWSDQPNKNGDFYLYLLQNKASLDNSYITESLVKMDLSDNKPVLIIAFDEPGKSIWSDITRQNISKSIAIVLDEKVLQAPFVMSEILEGRCIITGDFSINEISRINALINNEELPLQFKIKN